MIRVFSEAFIGKAFAPRVFDDIATLLGTVVATRLSIHVIMFQIAPSFFEFLAPVAFSAGAGIAPPLIHTVKIES